MFHQRKRIIRAIVTATAGLCFLPSAAVAGTGGAGPRTAIVDTGESARHWERHLRSLGEPAAIIPPGALENGLADYRRLVIPGPAPLTARATGSVARFVHEGGRLLLCAGAGEQAEGGGRSLAGTLGLRYQALPAAEGSWQVVLRTPGFLAAGLPRLQHLAVEAGQARFLDRAANDGFWRNRAGEKHLSEWTGMAALARGDHGRGRFAWLGFPLEAVGGDLENREALVRLTGNILAWLDRRPVLEKNPWPGHHQGAVTFSMDTETSFTNVANVLAADMLPAYTFFVLTDPAALFPEMIRQAARDPRAEIAAAEIAVHGDSHDVFRGQPLAEQRRRLEATRDRLREMTGITVVGFRPPEELYDHFTLEALLAAGYRYLFADDRADRAEPRLLQLPGGRLVQFPMLNDDDIKLIMLPGRTDTGEIKAHYRRDMDAILDHEGLYMANFHTHVLATRHNIPVLEDAAAHALEKRAWVTTCLEAARWWRRRGQVAVSLRGRAAGGAIIALANDGDEALENLSLSLWLPEAPATARAEAIASGRTVFNQRLEGDRFRFFIPRLEPAGQVEYLVTWQE